MKKIHLVCNAHLDPMWLWEWEEGAAEAISTFRVAAHFCEQYDGFVFNHNEVTLYKWVEEYEPALFERIQRLVKEGKWHIMGGWYLQPDCNIPCGESIVRQALIGKQYFMENSAWNRPPQLILIPSGTAAGWCRFWLSPVMTAMYSAAPTKTIVPFRLPILSGRALTAPA